MSEISGLSSAQKLKTSQPLASLETVQKTNQTEATLEMQEVKQLETDLLRLNDALQLANEIRTSLESALRNLST